MAAQISSTQSAVTIIGASRDDVATGLPVTLDSVDTATTYSWSLVYVPPDSALTPTSFSGSEVAKSPGSFTPDVEGAYLVRLVVDFGLATEDTQYVRLRVISAVAGLKQVAAGETYTGSTIIPVDLTSTGWADDQNENFKALEALAKSGSFGERVTTVDPLYGEHSAIQDAIDFAVAEGAALADQWTVLVQVAEYTENLTLEPFVHLVAHPGGESYVNHQGAPTIIGRHTFNGAVGESIVLKGLRFINTTVSSDAIIDHQGGGSMWIVESYVGQDGVDASQGDAVEVSGGGFLLMDRTYITVDAGNPATTTAVRVGSGGIGGIRRCDIDGPTGVIGDAGANVLAVYWSDIEGATDAIQTDALNTEVLWSYINGDFSVHPGAGALVQNVEVIAKWSNITGTLDYDTTGIVGNTELRTGALEYSGLNITGALTSRGATVSGTSVFYDNGATGLAAENVQDALDEVYVYASEIRSLDDAYDSDLGAGAGRTVIADSGSVDIVDAGVAATTPAAGNTDGSLRAVGFIELGGLGEPEIRLDPNPFGSGAFFLLGRNVNPTGTPLGIDTFIMANSTGNPSYRNYNLRLTTKSTDGGGDVGDIYVRGGDGLANGVSTPNGATLYFQAGSAYDGTADAGDILLLPGQSAGGARGRVWLAFPDDMTAASLTAAGAYVGGVDGDAVFATNMGAVTLTIASGDAVGDVVTKIDALEGLSASEAAGVITITTDAVGPDAYVYLSQADVGVDAALGGFSGVLQTDGTAPSGIWIEASADQEITFGATGAVGPMIYNADTGKLTVPGLIDPTGMIFEQAGAPSTGATEGGIFVSDGTGGLTAGNLYFRKASDGSITDISTGGGGGGGGGSSIQKIILSTDLSQIDASLDNGQFLAFNPFDTSSMNVPSGTPYTIVGPAYPSMNELLSTSQNDPDARETDGSYWEDLGGNSFSVPATTTETAPASGLASNAPISRISKYPSVPPSGNSTGFYYEVEFQNTPPDCLRVGLFNGGQLDPRDETQRLTLTDIIGGPSPAGDLDSSQAASLPTIAFQTDGEVYINSTSPTVQFAGGTVPASGDRIGVLLEFHQYATRTLVSTLNPTQGNDFQMRVYFYYKPSVGAGSWLNSADPATGAGAVYMPGVNEEGSTRGTFATGSIQFANGAGTSDGETFTIEDGLGSTRVYEWDLGGGGSVSGGDVLITYTGAETAEQMRDLAISAVQTDVTGGNIEVYVAAGSTDTMFVQAVQHGTSFNGFGPTASDASMNDTAFANGTGAPLNALSFGAALANDIRAKVDVDFTVSGAVVQGDYFRIRNTSTGIYEYLGVGAAYTSEITIDSGNAGTGDSVSLEIGSGPVATLTMTSVSPGPAGVDEFVIGATAQDTAVNLRDAINASANWTTYAVAEIDPINDRMVVVKPTVALGADLDFSGEAHTNLTTSGGATLFEAGGVQRVNFITTDSSLQRGFEATINRFGANSAKGQRMVFVYNETNQSASSNYVATVFSLLDGAAGNNLVIEGFKGDSTGTSLGTGGALTGGQDFPQLQFYLDPADWTGSGAHLPAYAEPWGDEFGQPFPIDTAALGAFGIPLAPLTLTWGSPGVANPTGAGRSMNVVFDSCETSGNVVIEYFRSDLPYTDEATPEVASLSDADGAPFSGTVSVGFPILRIQSVTADIVSGSFTIEIGDLYAPPSAPIGLSSGVATPGTVLTDPPPSITVFSEGQNHWTFQPAVGGTANNMVDLYNEEPGSPAVAIPPAGSPQRLVLLFTAHYEVENT